MPIKLHIWKYDFTSNSGVFEMNRLKPLGIFVRHIFEWKTIFDDSRFHQFRSVPIFAYFLLGWKWLKLFEKVFKLSATFETKFITYNTQNKRKVIDNIAIFCSNNLYDENYTYRIEPLKRTLILFWNLSWYYAVNYFHISAALFCIQIKCKTTLTCIIVKLHKEFISRL